MSRINQSARHHLDHAARNTGLAALSLVGAAVTMVAMIICIVVAGIGAMMLQVNPAAMTDRPILRFLVRIVFGS